MNKIAIFNISIFFSLFSSITLAEPVLMSTDWAQQACIAWNEDPVLTKDLVKSGWRRKNT